MLFYWFLLLLVFLLAFRSKGYDLRWSCIFLLLLFLGAMRGETVGTDVYAYSLEFKSLNENPTSWGRNMHQFELGFFWIMAKFKTYLSTTPMHFFHFLFCVTFILYAKFIKNNSDRPGLCLLFFLGFTFYFTLYNTMRQNFCFALISFVSFPYIFNKPNNNRLNNIFFYIISLSLIAYYFHQSQFILLLLLPIAIYYKAKIFNPSWLILYILISLFLGNVLSHFLFSQMSSYAYIFNAASSNYGGYMLYDQNIGKYSQMGNIVNSLFAIYVILICRKRKYLDEKSYIFLIIFVVGIILYNVLTPISWIFQRIAEPFSLFKIFVFTKLWNSITNKRERIVYRVCLLLYMVLIYNNRLVDDNNKDVIPYVNYYLSNIF